jgi:predicted amidohydrolase YtcJ
MDDALPTASAIRIQGERIAAIGDDASILAEASPATVVVDLQGRTMTPGFIDSHTHRLSQYDRWGHSGPEEIIQESLRQGWTGLVDAAVDEGEWNEVLDLAERGRLLIRVDGYLLFNTFEGNPLPDWYNAYKPGQRIGSNLRAAGLKFFIDFDSGRVLLFDPPRRPRAAPSAEVGR